MKIRIQLMIQEHQIDDEIEIDDYKVEELSEDELEAAIDMVIRNWADKNIAISWELENRDSSGEE